MLNTIQSLRGIFAIFIFLHHVDIFTSGGDSGVCFFIVLSGFVLCDGYQKKFQQEIISYCSFIKRRLAKIYPLHILCFIGAYILSFSMEHNPEIWFANLLLLQSWSPNPDIHFSANSVSWFLSVMVFCYLLFPIIIRFVNQSSRDFFIISCILFIVYFVGIQFVPSGMFNNIIYINPLLRLPDFILGIILWQIIGSRIKSDSHEKLKTNFIAKSVIELLVVLLFVITLMVYSCISQRYGVVSLWWPVTAAIIVVFSLFDVSGGILTRLLQTRLLLFFGNISFSFYMVHFLVINTTRRLLTIIDFDMSTAAFVLLAFTFSVAFSYIISRYFEKPFTNRLYALLSTKSPRS